LSAYKQWKKRKFSLADLYLPEKYAFDTDCFDKAAKMKKCHH